jgi:hypothetical protein
VAAWRVPRGGRLPIGLAHSCVLQLQCSATHVAASFLCMSAANAKQRAALLTERSPCCVLVAHMGVVWGEEREAVP